MDVSEVDFGDFESAKAWFETQPWPVATILAARNAMRLLPNLNDVSSQRLLTKAAIRTFHALLTACAACVVRSTASRQCAGDAAIYRIGGQGAQAGSLLHAATGSAATAADLGRSVSRVFPYIRTPIEKMTAKEMLGILAASSLIETSPEILTDALALGSSRQVDVESLRARPLWTDGTPQIVEHHLRKLVGRLQKDDEHPGAWEFWVRWYQGLLEGTWTDWDLCHEIALIPPEEWDKGPSHIAQLIRSLEDKRRNQFREQFAARAPVLTAQPELTELTTEGVARQIEDAISRYMRDAGTNSIPEEFEALELLPQRFRAVAMATHIASQSGDRLVELEEKIADLAEEVLRLRAELERARAVSNRAVFSKAFCEQAGKSLGDWKMWGALSGGCWVVLGNPTAAEAMNTITGLVRDLIPGAMSPSPLPHLPQGGGSIGV